MRDPHISEIFNSHTLKTTDDLWSYLDLLTQQENFHGKVKARLI